MLWTHWFCTHCFFSSPVTFTITSALSSKFFIYFFVNTNFPSYTDHPHMTSNTVSGILSKRPLMSFTVMVVRYSLLVLFAQLVIFIPTLILNLFWFSSCPCSGPRPVPAVDDVLVFSFTRAHPCGRVCSFLLLHVFVHSDLLTPRRYWLMPLWTPRLTGLSGPVSGLPLPASPLASADSHYLCNVRPWLRQGVGCSRADPRGILSLHVHPHAVSSHVLRKVSPLLSRHRAAPELSWPPHRRHGRGFRRATCGPLLYVAGQASKVCAETSFCTSLWAWLPRSFTRLLWIVVLPLLASGSRSRQSFLECDQRACGYVPRGQWALLDADMPKLIDRSACLVEPVVVESLCSSRACAVPALSTSSAASSRCSRLYPIARPC